MMSRITLNLKKAGVQLNSTAFSPPKSLLFDRRRRRRRSSATYPSYIMSILPSIEPIAAQGDNRDVAPTLPSFSVRDNFNGNIHMVEIDIDIDQRSVRIPLPAALVLPSFPAAQMA